MASGYQFGDEETKAIEQAHRESKDKRAEARLKALELRAKGASSNEVAEATGFRLHHLQHIDLPKRYATCRSLNEGMNGIQPQI